ncbi:MAG: BMC domain-containing protein [candidate division Zixibacteria bacterium]|nr:BMC domain-containing protein [candidate division Zixibacteria bacterium]
MERQALGLIETVGLIGAIEAADAAAKAAAVRLVQSEVTDGALVTVHIEGELGAVQAAVEAGVAACQKVGQLLSHVVIPRPDSGLDAILDHPTRALGPKKRGNPPSAPAPRQSPLRPPVSTTRESGAPRTMTGHGYASMTVAALRRLARRRGDVQISGRDLARADKDLLARLLLEADARRGADRR